MNEIVLAPGEHVMLGYGSLLSIASMERTLAHAYAGPLHIVRVDGWRRGWDVQMPNTTWAYRDDDHRTVVPARVVYLNVRRAPNAHINAAAFVVSEHELANFDERERIYDRVDVSDALADLRVVGGSAWMYEARAEFLWRVPSRPPDAIVRRSYLDILDTAHAELGNEFTREYEATSDDVPTHLVVDDFSV
jgi:hypothetical protein